MNRKKFAEALVFQCMEDLYDPRHMQQSMDFFSGDGFQLVAAMAEMSSDDRVRLLRMVGKQVGKIVLRIAQCLSENTENSRVPVASIS
jgi:hypothetical protein